MIRNVDGDSHFGLPRNDDLFNKAGPGGALIGAEAAKKLAGEIPLMEELAPDRKASEHIFPCCESGEQFSGINSG